MLTIGTILICFEYSLVVASEVDISIDKRSIFDRVYDVGD